MTRVIVALALLASALACGCQGSPPAADTPSREWADVWFDQIDDTSLRIWVKRSEARDERVRILLETAMAVGVSGSGDGMHLKWQAESSGEYHAILRLYDDGELLIERSESIPRSVETPATIRLGVDGSLRVEPGLP